MKRIINARILVTAHNIAYRAFYSIRPEHIIKMWVRDDWTIGTQVTQR